jgi:serine/threonine-protein kinase RsbW
MIAMRSRYPARADAVPIARTAALDCVHELGAGELVAQAVGLAVTEACGNVVVHAYRDRSEPGSMTVLVEKPDGFLCVTVIDNGVGIAPRPDSPGLGMGLPLISHLSDSLELRSRREGGAEIRMWFELASASTAA